MASVETIAVRSPATICGHLVNQVLVPDQTFLASGDGGRLVILKALDPDCILKNTLHPSVRDRLSRVRELAHPNVANLFGVERDADKAYLVWDYIDGVTFDTYCADERSLRELALAARELVLAVDLLHVQGIVHGALVASNVIVSSAGVVRLTHISPLIYTDPGVDIGCVWNLLDHAAEQLGERGAPLAAAIAECRTNRATLRQLASRLGPLIDTRDLKKEVAQPTALDSSQRKRALVGAAVAAAMGVALAMGVWYATSIGGFSLPESLRLPFHNQADR
jgi:hypothetical protein